MEEKRNITVTLDKAKEWFNSGNAAFKELALQAFSEDELVDNFKNIKSFKDACEALGLYYNYMAKIPKLVAADSRASAAMFKLNIIRKALNLGYDLHLTVNSKNSHIYYPYNPFAMANSTYFNPCEREVIGKIKSEGILYFVLDGGTTDGGYEGLGRFRSGINVGFATASFGFLGCASEKIAQHFGKYFGMLITEAKYADMVDFEVIEDKYGNTK